MTSDTDILHHVGLVTRDMDATIGQYERLGFSFTPLTVPRVPLRPGAAPEPLGAGNRTAVFADNYLEILAIVDHQRWAAARPEQRGPYDLDRPLARYEGLHVMHFGTDDIDAVHERLTAESVPNTGIRPFQRPVDTPEGAALMRARAIGFPPDAHPEALLQVAQHLTPELVFQPRYQQHDNGAVGIVEITVCGTDPTRYAARYAAVTGHGYRLDGDTCTIDLGRSRIRVTPPEAVPTLIPGARPPAVPSLVGYSVAVTDLAATRHLLADRGVRCRATNDSIVVDAADAAGSAVTFVNA